MQQFPAEGEEKYYESHSSNKSFCKAVSFQFLFCLYQGILRGIFEVQNSSLPALFLNASIDSH